MLSHRLHEDRRFGDAEARAAVFLGHGDAEPVALGHRGEEGVRVGRGAVALQPVRIVEAGTDLQHLVANLLLFVGQGEIHVRAFRGVAWLGHFCPMHGR